MLNEKAILLKVSEGDEKSFKLLFDHYWDNIYGVAFAFLKSHPLAEESTQDIFLKVWVKRELLSTIAKFDSYLYVIAKNHLFNELRKKINEVPFTKELLNHYKESSDSPEQQLIVKESESLLQQAIGSLPPQQKLIYRLSRNQGLSHEEIATQLGITKNTVKSHMNKALKTVHQYLIRKADGNLLIFCLAFLHI